LRGVSQVIVAILLVGTAVVAGSALSYIVADMMSTYKPSETVLARVGDVEVELSSIISTGYRFTATAKLVNLGSKPIDVSGYVVVLVKGTTGKAQIVSCPSNSYVTINPGEIKEIVGYCYLDKTNALQNLFGTTSPPADVVKSSISFLYIRIQSVSYYGGDEPAFMI